MKKTILTLMLMVALLPLMANAYEQVADGVYQDGSTLYIESGVTSLGNLQVNPATIYCYAAIPPACVSNTFTGYGATLHVPTAAMVNYFSAQYWYNFNIVMADAVEPTSLTLNHESVTIVIGDQFHINASVTPINSTPSTVSWYSTNTSVATVSNGTVTTIAPGECDIIAHCAVLQTLCHVTVSTTRVTITLDKHEAKVLPNHMLTLTATCSPMSTDLTVMSSDNTIAIPRLVNGSIQVLGLKEGTATITVGSVDGTANTDACTVTVYTEIGDLNVDGYVNIGDVTSLIDYLLSGDDNTISLTNSDCDEDGNVNIGDVTMLIDYLLSGFWPWDPHKNDWVDLGLPSGTLWATCNVGANSPEEYGDYFAWGETEPKVDYSWSNYKWCNGSDNTLTKYCTSISFGYNGFVDNKTELGPEDDAAFVNWGSSWRMPSSDQLEELETKCTWTRTNKGWLVRGPNGNTLFWPAAGASFLPAGTYGAYWTRTLYTFPSAACGHRFDGEGADFFFYYRLSGLAVRPVRMS